ncbi:MAG: hypothetical protein KKA62_05745 [Nanoarchaeota archaeon]|nr:hypothetical protein [Nanoarchaeota archaeon]MBU1644081.1 hypothetical protein [Nanoarchaeota archaeon]MBU1977427.1 hypothetical protein [Nanoarchaeota archaeon]
MGWLFGRKKSVPKVPPAGRLDDKALRFPTSLPQERVIEPEKVKEVVGFDKPVAFPEEIKAEVESKRVRKGPSFSGLPEPMSEMRLSSSTQDEDLFVKVDVYQRILGEMETVKKSLLELSETSTNLETSEYNEEKHFGRLKKQMKSLHDDLLSMDKTVFKS